MGAKRVRKERFLKLHPFCCFCGGESPSSTIDHVPNRASFPQRVGPEGFEFPACDGCQRATRLDELAFSIMVRFCRNEGDYDQAQFLRLLDGIKNNMPELLPDLSLTASDKRRGLRKLGLLKPASLDLSELPLAGIPAGYQPRIVRYIRKIVLALYYRHLSKVAPKTRKVWTMWSTGQGTNMNEAIRTWSEMTPIIDVGKRQNIDIGNQFRARLNYNEELDAFVTIGQFSAGLIFYGSCLTDEIAD
ncbi:hypothetical protein N8940_01840 [Sphingomonadaceae bacterium]|nr:hypothetical protein [Sphingomonadaceae bacterium]